MKKRIVDFYFLPGKKYRKCKIFTKTIRFNVIKNIIENKFHNKWEEMNETAYFSFIDTNLWE